MKEFGRFVEGADVRSVQTDTSGKTEIAIRKLSAPGYSEITEVGETGATVYPKGQNHRLVVEDSGLDGVRVYPQVNSVEFIVKPGEKIQPRLGTHILTITGTDTEGLNLIPKQEKQGDK